MSRPASSQKLSEPGAHHHDYHMRCGMWHSSMKSRSSSTFIWSYDCYWLPRGAWCTWGSCYMISWLCPFSGDINISWELYPLPWVFSSSLKTTLASWWSPLSIWSSFLFIHSLMSTWSCSLPQSNSKSWQGLLLHIWLFCCLCYIPGVDINIPR